MEKNKGWRQDQLAFLFNRQKGRCYVCGEPAILDFAGGKTAKPLSAVRFRIGSAFGEKGRPRPRVMAHRKCADDRSNQIQLSQPIEETRARSRRWPSVQYSVRDQR